jgi:hypothetical protein
MKERSDQEIKAILAGILAVGLSVCTGTVVHAETAGAAAMDLETLKEALPFLAMIVITIVGIGAVMKKRKM